MTGMPFDPRWKRFPVCVFARWTDSTTGRNGKWSERPSASAAIQLSTDSSREAEAALIAALQDESDLVRRTAAESLLVLGSVRGLAAVVAGSRHGHGVRTKAALKLAKMNSGEAVEAVPALMVLLQYPRINWRTHFIATDALAAIGDAAIPSLVERVASRIAACATVRRVHARGDGEDARSAATDRRGDSHIPIVGRRRKERGLGGGIAPPSLSGILWVLMVSRHEWRAIWGAGCAGGWGAQPWGGACAAGHC